MVIDDDTKEEKKYGMFWCGDFEDNSECWECDYKPNNQGIYWYRFELSTDFGEKVISKGMCLKGTLQENCGASWDYQSWQMTVYHENFNEGKFLEGGVMYQIFPDRFFFSGKKKNDVPEDRIIHENWEEEPLYNYNNLGAKVNCDYFCGDLLGIAEKLSYLAILGITCIYLNPIFEAHANHRYNTADYKKIDPLLGEEDDFIYLCKKAREKGIKVILDGVFSHTGSDSVYFNKEKRYADGGAYNNKDSEYFSWYNFKKWPSEYDSWWGFDSLPEVNELNANYCNFICGNNGVIEKWLRLGASGYRLDVADELPDEFIENVKKAANRAKADSIIIGEVWEDATNKISYSKRRKYLLGNKLDSVMNYPFRKCIIDFIKGGDAAVVMDSIINIIEHYPKPALNILMNSLGTHDTERILTIISGTDKQKHFSELNSQEQKKALYLLKIAVAMQYTLPGIPCIYYGDEAGLMGGKDPFCRRCFPWNNISSEIFNFYVVLGKIRRNYDCLKNGEFFPIYYKDKAIVYTRKNNVDSLTCAFNLFDHEKAIELPETGKSYTKLIGDVTLNKNSIILPPYSFTIISA